MRLRHARETDFEGYCAVVKELDQLHARKAARHYRNSGDVARSQAYFRNLLRDPQRALLLAIEEKQIVGYALVDRGYQPVLPALRPLRWANLSELVVAKKFRRQGVGRALMEACWRWAKRRGYRELRLSVAAFNAPARAFYRRLGFVPKHTVFHLPLEGVS